MYTLAKKMTAFVIAIIIVLGLWPGMPTAQALTLSANSAASLTDAIASITSDAGKTGTISLTGDIDFNGPISLTTGENITINMDGHNLNITGTGANRGLSVTNGSLSILSGGGTTKASVSTDAAYAVYASGPNSSITLDGNVISQQQDAVNARANATVKIKGDVVARKTSKYAVNAYDGTNIEVIGDVTSEQYAGVYADTYCIVKVSGNVKIGGSGIYSRGAHSSGGSTVEINGNVTSSGTDAAGVSAYKTGTLTVNGNVTSLSGAGAWVLYNSFSPSGGGTIYINGTVSGKDEQHALSFGYTGSVVTITTDLSKPDPASLNQPYLAYSDPDEHDGTGQYDGPDGTIYIRNRNYISNNDGYVPAYAVDPDAPALSGKASGINYGFTPLGGAKYLLPAALDKLKDVYVNGSKLVRNADYTAISGSTIIELMPTFIAQLPAGQHTLRADFSDGYAQTQFTTGASNQYRIIANKLNVRAGAGTANSATGALYLNDIVAVTAQQNGWGQVTLANGSTGWILLNYAVPVSDSITRPGSYSATANLNIRAGAGTTYAKLGKLTAGTVISVKSTANGWATFDYNGVTAYVSALYLR